MAQGWRASPVSGASWHMIGLQLGYSLVAQVALVCLCALIQPLWAKLEPRIKYSLKEQEEDEEKEPTAKRARSWLDRALGHGEREGNKNVETVWAVLDFLASGFTMGFWIDKTYFHGVRGWVLSVEYLFVALFALDGLLRLVRGGFSPLAALSREVLLDIWCAIPLALEGGEVRCWLSFAFLRSLGVLWSFERLMEREGRASGILLGGDLRRRVLTTAVRLAVVICNFAAAMFLLEYLGDIPKVHDVYVPSEMGDISFHQMCYFILITVSTIGFGDFSPKTLFGRTFLLCIILGGVAFFTYEVNRLIALRAMQVSGRGSFKPPRGAAHVLVCGGAVTSGSATLSDFLGELCHPLRAAGDEVAPQVVLLCEGEPCPALRRVLAKKFAKRCTLLSGSPLLQKDLQRAKAITADMALVLADLAAADAAEEDEETVLIAAALHRLHPTLPLRVMLIRRDSKRLAITAGLPRSSVVSAHELAPRLIALSLRCVGAGALLSNLVRLSPPPEGTPGPVNPGAALTAAHRTGHTMSESGAVSREAPLWLREYAFGAAHALHGVLLGEKWEGVQFHEAACSMFASHGVLLIAVQYEGAVLVNPQPGSEPARLSAGDVAFALGLTAAHVASAAGEAEGGGEFGVKVGTGLASLQSWKSKFHADSARARTAILARIRAEALARAEAWQARPGRGKSGMITSASGNTLTAYNQLTVEGGDPSRHDHQQTIDGAGRIVKRGNSLASIVNSMQAFKSTGALAPASPQPVKAPAPSVRPHPALPAGKPAASANLFTSPAGAGVARRAARRAEYLAKARAPHPLGEGDFSSAEAVAEICELGGHTVLVSLDSRPSAWAQVEGIVEALRQPFLPAVVPVVILTTARPPRRLVQRFQPQNGGSPDVFFVDASLGASGAAASEGGGWGLDMAGTDWGRVLILAGVDTAGRVLYLAGEPPSSNEYLIDRRAVLFATVLETYHREWARDVFCATELHNPHSVWHLRGRLPVWESQPPPRLNAKKTVVPAPLDERTSSITTLAELGPLSAVRRSHRALIQDALQDISFSGLRRCVGAGVRFAAGLPAGRASSSTAAVAAAAAAGMEGAGTGRGGQSPVLHPRFAAGRALFRTDVARLAAAAFFTPGVTEVLHALADPLVEDERLKKQQAQLWRVELGESPLAPFGRRGNRVGELFDHCAKSGVLMLGLFRQHAEAPESPNLMGGGGAAADVPAAAAPAASSKGGLLPYTVTCPHPDTRLRLSDAIFVLASGEWALKNAPEYEAERMMDAVLLMQSLWRDKVKKRKEGGGKAAEPWKGSRLSEEREDEGSD